MYGGVCEHEETGSQKPAPRHAGRERLTAIYVAFLDGKAIFRFWNQER